MIGKITRSTVLVSSYLPGFAPVSGLLKVGLLDL